MAKKPIKSSQALVTERKYQGKYVAFSPSKGKKVIAFGANPGAVIEKARKLGVDVPGIVFVPREDIAYIY